MRLIHFTIQVHTEFAESKIAKTCLFVFSPILKQIPPLPPPPGSCCSGMVKRPKLNVHTKTPFTQPPPKLLKSYTNINGKTLKAEEGLLLESHTMLRDSSSAEVNVGSYKNEHCHFSAHFTPQPSTGF